MFVFVSLLVIIGSTLAVKGPEKHYVRHYVEARENVERAKNFIQVHLPQDFRIHSNSVKQEHIKFAVLAGVIGALVKAYADQTSKRNTSYNPETVVQEYLPYAKTNYHVIFKTTHSGVEELSERLKPIFTLMDTLCKEKRNCNEKMAKHLKENPVSSDIKEAEKLLYYLSKMSKYFNKRAESFKNVLEQQNEEKFLKENVSDKSFTKFIKKMAMYYSHIIE